MYSIYRRLPATLHADRHLVVQVRAIARPTKKQIKLPLYLRLTRRNKCVRWMALCFLMCTWSHWIFQWEQVAQQPPEPLQTEQQSCPAGTQGPTPTDRCLRATAHKRTRPLLWARSERTRPAPSKQKSSGAWTGGRPPPDGPRHTYDPLKLLPLLSTTLVGSGQPKNLQFRSTLTFGCMWRRLRIKKQNLQVT